MCACVLTGLGYGALSVSAMARVCSAVKELGFEEDLDAYVAISGKTIIPTYLKI